MIDEFTYAVFVYIGLVWLIVGSAIVGVLAIRDCLTMMAATKSDDSRLQRN